MRQYMTRQSKAIRLTNGRLRLWNLSKLNNTTAFGSSAVEKNFSEFDLSSSLEQLDKIFIGSRPRKLTPV
jgi:hypothetical protein